MLMTDYDTETAVEEMNKLLLPAAGAYYLAGVSALDGHASGTASLSPEQC